MPAAVTPTPRGQVAFDLAKAPRFPSVGDLIDALGPRPLGLDRLLDAYVNGWLSREHETLLEADPPKLQCWLLARLLRLSLHGER